MENKSANIWFRGYDIIVGIVLILSAVLVFFGSQTLFASIINVLTLSVLLLGISKLASGITSDEVPVTYSWVNIVSGTVSILLALYVFFLPPTALSTTMTILMIGILAYGVDSFIIGFAKGFSGSIRTLLISAGIVSIIAALLGIFDSALATITAVSFISLALLIDGVEELTAGVTGHTAF